MCSRVSTFSTAGPAAAPQLVTSKKSSLTPINSHLKLGGMLHRKSAGILPDPFFPVQSSKKKKAVWLHKTIVCHFAHHKYDGVDPMQQVLQSFAVKFRCFQPELHVY